MGRGRAKAKQTRVARQLKYAAPATDLDALQRELRGSDVDEHHTDAGENGKTDKNGENGETDDTGYDEYADYDEDSDEGPDPGR